MLGVCISSMALSRSKIREYARFLSDRMAYELGLTTMQYNDIYEINYDFVDAVEDVLDDMVYGYDYATDRYYNCLDNRNEDISYVLSLTQYEMFLQSECFYRPFCIYDGAWAFRPYMVYTNRTYFYLGLPVGYHSYRGAHARIHFVHGYYINRYHHPSRYQFTPFRRHHDFNTYHRRDFGPGPAPRPRDVRPGRGEHHSGRVDHNPGRVEHRPSAGNRPDHGTRPRQETTPRRESEHRRESTRPERTEQRPQRTEQRQERTEQRPQRTEQRPQRTEQRPQRTEQRQERTEQRPQRTEQRPQRTEQRPQRTEQRQSTPQTSPSRQDSPRQQGGGGGVSRRGRG